MLSKNVQTKCIQRTEDLNKTHLLKKTETKTHLLKTHYSKKLKVHLIIYFTSALASKQKHPFPSSSIASRSPNTTPAILLPKSAPAMV